MDARSLRVLEWDKIKDKLAAYASFSLGKELVQTLQPSRDFAVIEKNLHLTTIGLKLLWKHGAPPFGGASDISLILKRVKIGGILDGSELLKITGVLYCSNQMQRYLAKSDDDFTEYIEKLSDFRQLAGEIERCLDEDGSVKDKATPELTAIRQRIQSLSHRIRERLDSIVHSNKNQKLLQESIVTIRGGRYVVPVKQEYRALFGGIVHDQSASGATIFVEPAEVVELNNQLRIAKQEEEREIQRILLKLSQMVEPEVDTIQTTLNTLAELDLIFAKAKYSKEIRGTAAVIQNKGYINIKKGRHPLLTGSVVPIDLWLGDKFSILVITGPNTGGKTVTLKTLGLFAVMTQAGLHIPADEGSTMAVFDNIFADIGDEQSIEQSLSTFSSHMSNIVKIIKHLSGESLVLLDELGAGTDPAEGAALAAALLDYLRINNVMAVATTHYSELKNYAYAHPEVENACVEFDIKTLQPTYSLSIGIPGKSNAFAIARRLGLSDEIVDGAQALMTEEQVKVDDIISEIEVDRQETAKARQEAEELRLEYQRLKRHYEELDAELTNKRTQIIAEARQNAEKLIKETRLELDFLIGELRHQQNQDLEKIVQEKRKELIKKQKNYQVIENTVKPGQKPDDDLKVGELVRVKSLNQVGSIIELSQMDALVQVGVMRINAKVNDLEPAAAAPKEVVWRYSGSSKMPKNQSIKSRSISSEINVLGYNIEDATAAVDKYLDDAFLSSLTQVRVIHGKGTGALRDAIQAQLQTHPHVKSFELASPYEGGSGVTVVELDR